MTRTGLLGKVAPLARRLDHALPSQGDQAHAIAKAIVIGSNQRRGTLEKIEMERAMCI